MIRNRLVRRNRTRARAERRLVGGEFVDLVDARRAALARHIGLDLEHTWTRLRTLQHGHSILTFCHSGARARGSPESITAAKSNWRNRCVTRPGGGYGFRAHAFGVPRNDG